MLLAITSFGGEAPMLAPDKLPENGAQATLDCRFSSGDLESALGLGGLAKQAQDGSVMPAGAWFTDDGNFFFWSDERTLVKSPVIEDFHNRLYATTSTAGPNQYLRVLQQRDAWQQTAGWDAGVTYALNAEVLYPMVVPANWSNATTYAQGAFAVYPSSSRLMYRSRKSGNLNNQPDTNPAWWDVWGMGKRYVSLQGSNLAKTPSTEPTWWRPMGQNIVTMTTKAGVPVPADWAAKVSGVYKVNVVTGDDAGADSPYNVPKAIADERVAADLVAPTNALIAVARNTWQTDIVVRASPTDADDTARAYHDSNGTKMAETVVQMYPIEAARLYTFDPPEKSPDLNEYVVTQIWIETGRGSGVVTVDPSQQN